MMPRCYSCGSFSKNPHREYDGRVERAYCDFCRAEREWKLEGGSDTPSGRIVVEQPHESLWTKLKRKLGF